jgi:hypothetical protein
MHGQQHTDMNILSEVPEMQHGVTLAPPPVCALNL